MSKYGLLMILHVWTYLLFHLRDIVIYIARYFFRTHFITDSMKTINNIFFHKGDMDWNNSMKPFTSPSDASSAFYLDNVRDNYSSMEKF